MSMKNYLLVLLLFITNITLISQEIPSDSLRFVLDKITDENRKLELLLVLAKTFAETDFPHAIKYAEEAATLAGILNKPLKKAEALLISGAAFSANRKDKEAIEISERALLIFEQAGDHDGVSRASSDLSKYYYYQYNADEAVKLAEKALLAAQENNVDTLIATAYFHLGNGFYRKNEFDKALEYHEKSLMISEKADDKKGIASSLNRLGILSYNTGDFQKSVYYYQRTIDIREELNDSPGVALTMTNLANAYTQLGDYQNAIASYQEAGEVFRQIGFNRGIASTLIGMAMIYENLRQYPTALEALQEYLKIYQEENNIAEIANAYNNIGILYNNILSDTLKNLYGNDYQDTIYQNKLKINIPAADEALKYHLLALEKRRELNDTRAIGVSLLNIGGTYTAINELLKGRQIYQEWLSIADIIANDDQTSSINQALGKIYKAEGNIEKAIESFTTAMQFSKKINKRVFLRDISEELSELYERSGNFRRAYEYHKMYSAYKDSLVTDESRRLIHEMQVKFETDAKETENQLLRKDQLISATKLKEQKITIYFFIFFIIVVITFVVMLIRQNRIRKMINTELEGRNKLITEQKKEITDSIQYASRIQNAILPPDELIDRYLPERFIIYRPRDIVSGDFYWLTEKNNRIFVMIADCTGHGVPGAFMSMLGVAFLNEIVSKNPDIHANQVLDELRNQVMNSLHQTGKEGESQDGMDVAIFILNKSSLEIEFAGANNPLFIYRNNELTELKSDKMPIGIHTITQQPFSNHKAVLQSGDMIYSFTDGFPDQFGGPQDKKFMIKNFKKTLENINQKPMAEQKAELEKILDNWMADTVQLDDILVMGVRIT